MSEFVIVEVKLFAGMTKVKVCPGESGMEYRKDH